MPLRIGVGAGAVGLEARRRDLAELLGRRMGPPVARVAVLLELDRQRAAALEPHREAELLTCPRERRLGKAAPVERGILERGAAVDELPILQIEQRAGQDGRNVFVAREYLVPARRVVERVRPRVVDHQPCDGLVPARGRNAELAHPHELGREARLLVDPEPLGLERRGEARDQAVATLGVERAAVLVARKGDAGARRLRHVVVEALRQRGQDARLEDAGVDLHPHQGQWDRDERRQNPESPGRLEAHHGGPAVEDRAREVDPRRGREATQNAQPQGLAVIDRDVVHEWCLIQGCAAADPTDA
jgi:hypothetical protein